MAEGRQARGRYSGADRASVVPPESPHRASRRTYRTDRAPAVAMVFPALRRALADSGEIVFFDRSWYNRAGVEKVMASAQKRLAGIDCDRKDPDAAGQPDPLIVGAPTDMRELEPGQRLSPMPFRTPGLT